MRRKLFAVVLSACFAAGLAVPAAAAERNGITLSGDSTYDTVQKITDEDLTLKIMLAIRDSDTITNPSDLGAVKDLEALTGINLEWEVIKGSDWSMKNSRIQAEESDPTVSLVASDGKTYSIGYIVGQYICEEGHYFINRDWMNELGLEDPTTVDELTEVLRAFKEAYPDYVPYEMGLDAGGYYDLKYVLPMFGIPKSDTWLYIDDDKQVQFSPVQDGFRQCVEWLSQCYAEGLLDQECLSQDINTLQTKLSEGNVGFFSAWRLKAMGWDDGVCANSECILPPSVDGNGAYMDRYLELARPCAFITAANEHVEESIRLLDAIMDTEMQADLYYGPQNPTEGTGWVYNEENGKIDTVTVSDLTVKNQIDCNTQFFAPGAYIANTYNLSEQRLEKIAYCEMYDEAGVINKYSSQYLSMAGLDAETLANFSLIETDINNAVKEAVADFVAHGVTDDSWNSFVSKFEGMGVDTYISTYQEAIDGMELD